MTNIHLLPAIISDLENRLHKFEKEHPTDKEQALINRQKRLINQLSDIYQDFESFTRYEMFRQMEDIINDLQLKSELDGVVIRLPFKIDADPSRFASIHFIP